MANELNLDTGVTGQNPYVRLVSSVGTVWNGAALVVPSAANWTDCDIPMTEVATTGMYQANMPAVPAGIYTAQVRLRQGVAPAVTDPVVGSGEIEWSGTAAVALAAVATAVADLPTNAELAAALAGADDAVLAAIAALHNLSPAQVNAEVVDALNTDTYDEPTTSPEIASLVAKIGLLYKALINYSDATATAYRLRNKDGVTVRHTSAQSYDGTTFVRGPLGEV